MALGLVQPERFFVAGLGRFHGVCPLTCDLKSLVGRPVRKTRRPAILAVGTSAWVADHPVLVAAPVPALLDLRLVDPEEVGEAVVALALVEIGIELGALPRWWGWWQLFQGEPFALVCCAIHHIVLRAEGRGLAAGHQSGRNQHIQVVRVVVARAGEEVVAGAAALV